jgi:hypothetical protein
MINRLILEAIMIMDFNMTMPIRTNDNIEINVTHLIGEKCIDY